MDKSKTNDADNSNMSAKPITLSSPFFVLQMNSHYSPRSVRNIYRSAAISLIVCIFIFIVALLNRKNFYGSSDLVYFMHGWYYSIIMYSAAVLILGLLFGWGLSFLDYHFLMKKSQNSFAIAIDEVEQVSVENQNRLSTKSCRNCKMASPISRRCGLSSLIEPE